MGLESCSLEVGKGFERARLEPCRQELKQELK
jgi:hypothetical protein